MDTTTAPAKPAHPIKLHRFALSGHSHRVEMFMSAPSADLSPRAS